MRLALYQPDIPQNTGTIIRLCACFDIPLDIIEPCGFVFSDAKLRRAGMDYRHQAVIHRHKSWETFENESNANRIVLLTTKASVELNEFKFAPEDTLLMGNETEGVPKFIHENLTNRVRVPINTNTRSLNVAVCASIVLWEALRQTEGFINSKQ